MSDHLLRLAKLMRDAFDPNTPGEDLHKEARQLVRDLEAAPAPERRTITREEHDAARKLLGWHIDPESDLRDLLAVLRLTVEDA